MAQRIARFTKVWPSFDVNQLSNHVTFMVPAGMVARVSVEKLSGTWSTGNLDFYRIAGGVRTEITGRTIAAGGGEELLEESDLQGTTEVEIYLDAANGSAAYARIAVVIEEPQA